MSLARARRDGARPRRSDEPVIRADDEGSSVAGRRSRRCASTAAGRSGSPSISTASTASAAGIGLPAVDRRRVELLVGSRSRRPGVPTRSLRLFWTAGPPGAPVALALVGAIPDWIEEARERGATARLAARASRARAVAPARRKSTSYAVNIAAEAEARTARRRRGGVRRRRRDRPRGTGDERLVARRRDALHAVARARDPRRRDARDAHRARAGRAATRRGGRYPLERSSQPTRRSRRRRSARSCLSSRSTASAGRGPGG